MPSTVELQQQIDVVQGKRLGSPTNSLRALEDRLLHKPQGAPQSQDHNTNPDSALRQTQRLDHGQAPLVPVTTPVAKVPHQTSAPVNPSSPAPISSQQRVASMAYTPELSAPDTGRFSVEPFSEPGSPESLLQPAPSVAPVQRQADNNQDNLNQPVVNTRPQLEDDEDWLNQAGEQAPQKISDASRNALDSSAALAAEDFERDLAAILGQSAPVQPGPDLPQHPPQGNQNSQAGGETAEAVTEEKTPHPTHDIFDQMGLGMQYANSFDLGSINLQNRFEQFDRELAEAQSEPTEAVEQMHSPFVNPYASPMELDEIDLVAELAEIGADYPHQDSDQPQSGQKEDTKCAPASSPQQEETTQQQPVSAPPQKQQHSAAPPRNQQSTSEEAQQQDVLENNNPNQIEQTTGEDNEQSIG